MCCHLPHFGNFWPVTNWNVLKKHPGTNVVFPIETTIPTVVLGNPTLSTFVLRSPFVFMSPIVTCDIASSQMI